jgi:hypothetical protein
MFSAYRRRFGTKKAVLLLGAIYLASQIAIACIIHDMGALAFLKAQTTFSRTTYVEQVKQWQERDLMGDYKRHFYFDFLHPLWYALFLSALMAAGFNRHRAPSRANRLLCLPFIAGAMDLVENCFHVRFISDVDTIPSWMIVASASAANAKWALAGTSLVVGVLFVSRRPHERTEKVREAAQL